MHHTDVHLQLYSYHAKKEWPSIHQFFFPFEFPTLTGHQTRYNTTVGKCKEKAELSNRAPVCIKKQVWNVRKAAMVTEGADHVLTVFPNVHESQRAFFLLLFGKLSVKVVRLNSCDIISTL